MSFEWLCPGCEGKHFYGGSKTTRATTNCPQTKTKYKVWQYRMVVEEPTLENLHPPVEVGEKTQENRRVDSSNLTISKSLRDTNSKPTNMGIDFSYLTNNSSFQRAIMEFMKKFVPGLENIKPRGTKEVMKQSFNQNAYNYKLVMVELKEKLKERREKNE